jgi:hypothetical protein
MEASVAGAPPAVAGAPTETAQPIEQAQQAPVEQTATEPAQQQTEQTERDPVAAIDEMAQRFDRFLEQNQKPAEPDLATDLLSALEGEPEAEAPEHPGVERQGAPQEGVQSPAAQEQLDEVRSFIAGQVQELVTPLQRGIAVRDMEGLKTTYPDIDSKEVLPLLAKQMDELVQISGNPDLIYNKTIVERTYKAVKAELADAAAVPAEQAATQGASLETHAGQTQAGSPSQSDQYIATVYGKQPKSSVFG